jgi:MFS family permease
MSAFLTITATTMVHTSVHLAGLAFAIVFAAAICGRLGWGVVSDRYFAGDRLVPLAIICVLAALGSGLAGLLRTGQIFPLFVASAVLGLSSAGWNGLMAAALSEIGGSERAASALGVGLTGMFAASAIAPWLFGLAADRTTLDWAWAGTAAMCLVAMVPVLWLRAYIADPSRAAARSAF